MGSNPGVGKKKIFRKFHRSVSGCTLHECALYNILIVSCAYVADLPRIPIEEKHISRKLETSIRRMF